MAKQKFATQDRPLDFQAAPADWSDRKAWDRYLHANYDHGPFAVPTQVGSPGWQSVRFLDIVKARGGHIWFPGCGTGKKLSQLRHPNAFSPTGRHS